MKTKTSTIYIADDNTEFTTEKDCIAYEEQIEKRKKFTTYWNIVFSPDLTEGRGYYGSVHVEFYNEAFYWINSRSWIEDWCFQTYGKRIDYVQGVSPMENWKVYDITREGYLNESFTQVGDYKYPSKRLKLTPNGDGTYSRESIS
jgi:hypothetical protein